MNIGELGENIACKFLKNKGFEVLERNFSRKFGEIDIISKKKGEIYFIEVKTTLIKNKNLTESPRPEERVDNQKIKKIGKTVQIYLLKHKLENSDWKFLVLSILFNPLDKTAKVKVIEDAIPE